MRLLKLLLLLALAAVASPDVRGDDSASDCMELIEEVRADSVPAADTAVGENFPEVQETAPDSIVTPKNKQSWVRQLINNGFHINDPGINYPRFARFCLKVYNWGDRTFNQYDTAYVVSTGKNWKALVRNDNWMESFLLQFPQNKSIRITSDPYFDLGGSLCFMAVSLSYTVNAKTIFTHTEENRSRFNFNFTSGLFSANIHYSSIEGGAKIRKFMDVPEMGRNPMSFNDITTTSFYADAYYFFNHRHYSQAAAYCYSKYQLKSAGSWLLGFLFNRQNIGIDFRGLPEEMLDKLPTDERVFHFHYKAYNIAGGYAYNWVIVPRKWLVNVTVMPSIGYRHSYEDATDGWRGMFSTNIRAMIAAVYNYKHLFVAATGNFYGHTYFGKRYTFFNSTEVGNVTVGVRF